MSSAPEAAHAPPAAAWRAEARALLTLGGPLIAAQLATIALAATDVIMTGWLGPAPLAAGALAAALIFPFVMFGTGVAMAVAPLVAQALGARRRREVRRSVRQGLWVALLLAALTVPALMQAEPLLRALGQEPALAALSQSYIDSAAWHVAPAWCFVALRGFLAAHGETRVVMLVTLLGVAVNILGNYALMFGNFGLPRLELFGAGISTTVTQMVMFTALAGHVGGVRRYRRYALFARFYRADWPRFRAILRLGAPIGLMLAAETGLFSAAALLVGWLGEAALAGHAVALQLAAITFMVPLGLSHATTARVGLAAGARDRDGMRRAAWASLGLTTGFMSLAALTFWLTPQPLIALFLDPADPAAATAFALAVSYLGVAALFQLVDGAQVSAAAALRGLGDTGAPMVIAFAGYWAVGFPAAWLLGFPLGLEGVGVWLGLAAGLAAAAVLLIARLAYALARTDTPR